MPRRRIPLVLLLPKPETEVDPRCRPIREADKEKLAALLHAAYRGTIDDEGETFADALGEVEKTFRGDYGRFLREHSYTIDDEELLASACLVSWFEPHDGPLVVFLMTRPERKRQGLARATLARSIASLSRAGFSRLTLVVTEGNDPALRLYESLGFRPMTPRTARRDR